MTDGWHAGIVVAAGSDPPPVESCATARTGSTEDRCLPVANDSLDGYNLRGGGGGEGSHFSTPHTPHFGCKRGGALLALRPTHPKKT